MSSKVQSVFRFLYLINMYFTLFKLRSRCNLCIIVGWYVYCFKWSIDLFLLLTPEHSLSLATYYLKSGHFFSEEFPVWILLIASSWLYVSLFLYYSWAVLSEMVATYGYWAVEIQSLNWNWVWIEMYSYICGLHFSWTVLI